MTKYKIIVSFDEKNFFWIVLDKGTFIRNPTEKDLIGARPRYYNKTNICHICREKKEKEEIELTDKSILYPGNSLRYKCKNKSEEWICHRCYNIKRDKNKRHEEYKEIYLCNRRIGNLNPKSKSALGDKGQELTCRWRKVEDLNKRLDNYNTTIDHTRDSEFGILQSKISNLILMHRHTTVDGEERKYYGWVASFTGEHNAIKRKIKFDNVIIYCIGKNGIERIYIVPKEEVENRGSISILEYNPRRLPWYEKYRIIDEDILKNVNKIWKEVINER